ncbi:MAG: hypothetical protein JWO95_2631 [Verrucomicrobiales bacterium]|nr:hypothetical protein [Verrucomicrobiales bacterium]
MQLDETQKQKVTQWINEGLKLSDIQKRLEKELGLRMTYLEVRMLVDDLKLKPKDPEPPAEPKQPEQPVAPELPAEPGLPGNVKVVVDQIARANALVSGKVTFSDGKTAEWFLDQTGRLGIVPPEKGYKPLEVDLQAFNIELQTEFQKLGLG